jgi:hypothetical protein
MNANGKDSCMAASNQFESRNRVDTINLSAWICLLSMAVLSVASAAGCGLMANAMYVVRGNDAPAEFDELKEKKVAVVVRTPSGFNDASGMLISTHINELLARNVKKIDMVNLDEVQRIIDDQPLADRSMVAIGSRLRAEYVVFVEVSNLKFRDGQTLYKGRCNAALSVYKVSEGENAVFRKSFPEFIYPQHGAPVTDFDEVTFQRVYLSELALRVARTFFPFDPSIDVAKDASVSSLGAAN